MGVRILAPIKNLSKRILLKELSTDFWDKANLCPQKSILDVLSIFNLNITEAS
jgi:hypothetical protein